MINPTTLSWITEGVRVFIPIDGKEQVLTYIHKLQLSSTKIFEQMVLCPKVVLLPIKIYPEGLEEDVPEWLAQFCIPPPISNIIQGYLSFQLTLSISYSTSFQSFLDLGYYYFVDFSRSDDTNSSKLRYSESYDGESRNLLQGFHWLRKNKTKISLWVHPKGDVSMGVRSVNLFKGFRNSTRDPVLFSCFQTLIQVLPDAFWSHRRIE